MAAPPGRRSLLPTIHPHDDRPRRAGITAIDLTLAELTALSRMDVYRRVWSPVAGFGHAVGWYGIAPALVPAIHFDRDPAGVVTPMQPAGLVYLS